VRVGALRAAAERIDERLRELYGEVPGEVGVLHVAAVAAAADGGLRALRIGPGTPRSPADDFALSLARARVDAIVTTGRILRLEPDATHALLGPEAQRQDLRAWRARRLGRSQPARSAVLSSGRELDLDHPLLRAGFRPLLLTGPAAAARLSAAAQTRGIELVGLEPLDLRSALAALRARGLRALGIEAGPETALGLYEPPGAVDELMLSIYQGPVLPADALAGSFIAEGRIAQLLPRRSRTLRVGDWRFERYAR
jgi:riboflavin biosynthesis pyrimidine reductase